MAKKKHKTPRNRPTTEAVPQKGKGRENITPYIKSQATQLATGRKPRLLWANPFCLLDTSSGASMAVRNQWGQSH